MNRNRATGLAQLLLPDIETCLGGGAAHHAQHVQALGVKGVEGLECVVLGRDSREHLLVSPSENAAGDAANAVIQVLCRTDQKYVQIAGSPRSYQMAGHRADIQIAWKALLFFFLNKVRTAVRYKRLFYTYLNSTNSMKARTRG